jgi:hypothetical protein
LRRMVEVAEDTIRKMTIAHDLDGALDVIREMVKLSIVTSAGHSAATYEQTMEAVGAGLRCATHVFNGMMPFFSCVLYQNILNPRQRGHHIRETYRRHGKQNYVAKLLRGSAGVQRLVGVRMHCPLRLIPDGDAEFHQFARFVVKRSGVMDLRAQLVVGVP